MKARLQRTAHCHFERLYVDPMSKRVRFWKTTASAGEVSKHAQVVNKRFAPKRRLAQSFLRKKAHTNTPALPCIHQPLLVLHVFRHRPRGE